MLSKNMEELLDKIADIVDNRHNESFHMTVETARALIADYINEYIGNIMKKVIVVTNPELGWDCVVCIATSLEAAAKYLELESTQELLDDTQYVIHKKDLEKL